MPGVVAADPDGGAKSARCELIFNACAVGDEHHIWRKLARGEFKKLYFGVRRREVGPEVFKNGSTVPDRSGLAEFKKVWAKLHGEWNPNEWVYAIRFRLARVIGESGTSE